MRKSNILAWLVIAISLLILLHPYGHAGVPDTHDGNNHLVRFANYKIAIKEGQFPPRWAPNLMDRYGYPVFNVNYPLANILSLPFSIIKVNYQIIFKLLVTGFLAIGVIGLKNWLDIISDKNSGLLPAIIGWLFMPFLTSTIYFRGNIGEIAAYGLMPLILYFTEYIHKNKQINAKKITLFSLIFAAFLLSHNVTVVFFLPIMLLYALVRYKNDWSCWKSYFVVLLFGIGASLWFWLPAIAEMNLTNVTNTGLTKEYAQHFVTLEQLIFSPLAFGYSVPGSVDGLSLNVGLTVVLTTVISLLILLMKRLTQVKFTDQDWLLAFSSVVILLLAFLQTNYSSGLWQIVNIAEVIQFPWRLSIFTGVFTALSIYLLWQEQVPIIRWTIVFLLLINVHSTWRTNVSQYLNRDRVEYDTQTITTDILAENKPKKFVYEMSQPWQPSPQILTGEATVTTNYWNGSNRQYTVNVISKALIVEPTAYFAGWSTKSSSNGNSNSIQYVDNELVKGRIGYMLEPGSYIITSKFTQNTLPRLIGNTISGVVLLSFGLLYIKKGSSAK